MVNIPPLLIVPIHTLTASLDQKCAVRRLGKSQRRQEEKKGHFPKAIFSPIGNTHIVYCTRHTQQLQWAYLMRLSIIAAFDYNARQCYHCPILFWDQAKHLETRGHEKLRLSR